MLITMANSYEQASLLWAIAKYGDQTPGGRAITADSQVTFDMCSESDGGCPTCGNYTTLSIEVHIDGRWIEDLPDSMPEVLQQLFKFA